MARDLTTGTILRTILGGGAFLLTLEAIRLLSPLSRPTVRDLSLDDAPALLVADLVGLARQGAKALRRAGMALEDERTRGILRAAAMERGHTAALLQHVLVRRGQGAVDGLAPTGDVVPEWRHVERLSEDGRPSRIFPAVAAAERVTADRFRQALGHRLPQEVRFILGERLFAEIMPSRNRLGALGLVHAASNGGKTETADG